MFKKLKNKVKGDGPQAPPAAPVHRPQSHAAPSQTRAPQQQRPTTVAQSSHSHVLASETAEMRKLNEGDTALMNQIKTKKADIVKEQQKLQFLESELQKARGEYARAQKPQNGASKPDPLKVKRATRQVKVCMERVKDCADGIQTLEQLVDSATTTLEQRQKLHTYKNFQNVMTENKVDEEVVEDQLASLQDSVADSKNVRDIFRTMQVADDVDPEMDEELQAQLSLAVDEGEFSAAGQLDKDTSLGSDEDLHKILGVQKVPATVPSAVEDEDAKAMRELKAEMAARNRMPAHLA